MATVPPVFFSTCGDDTINAFDSVPHIQNFQPYQDNMYLSLLGKSCYNHHQNNIEVPTYDFRWNVQISS